MPALTFDDLLTDAPAPAGAAGQPAPAPTSAPPSGGPITFDDLIADHPAPSMVADIAKSAGAGYLRGVTGLIGAPADIAGWIRAGANQLDAKLQGRPVEDVAADADAHALIPRATLEQYGGAAMTKRLEDAGSAVATAVTGTPQDRTLYKPQTTPGQYAETIGEFVPGSVVGGSGSLPARIAQAVVPAVASEAAGQATKGTSLEGPARLVGALAGGLGTAVVQARGGAQVLAREGLEGISPQEVNAAQDLMQQGASLPGGGARLTFDEALNQVTGGRATRLSQLNRVVTNSGGEGGQIMADLYSQRPAQIDATGRAALDQVALAVQDPVALGQQVQSAAKAGVDATPEGQALAQARWNAGPEITPEQAGHVIQPDLRAVYDGREGVRAAIADQDYTAARQSDSWVPVDEKMVDVSRTVDRPMTPDEIAAAQVAAKAAPAAGSKPATLGEYIARNGGLSLDSGDAQALGFDKMKVPGAGSVARDSGKSVDSFWREKLIEDGYLPHDPDGGMSRDIRDELYSALENEQRGNPTYSAFDQDKLAARGNQAASQANAQALDRARSDIIRDHYRAGVKPADLDPTVVDRAAQAMASGSETDGVVAYNRAARDLPTVSEQVTEQVPQTVYGQVSPSSVLQHVNRQLQTAKGGIAKDLEATRRDLFTKDGTVEGSVEGLQNAREALNERIDAAQANGRKHAVGVLTNVRSQLDQALEQVPEQAAANANFRQNSAPLAPFDNTPALSKVIAQDNYGQHFTMPPDRVPGALEQGGPSASRAFNEVATPAAKEAYDQHLTTGMLNSVTDAAGNVSADRLRAVMRDNADVLAQHPGVQKRLADVAIARDGMEKIQGSSLARIAQMRPDVAEAARTLFPANPVPGSTADVARTIGAVATSDPNVARQLVRVHAESVFNQATRDLQAGPNVMGGANFVRDLLGNSQQAQNLEAAVKALPNGEDAWNGFKRFTEVAEATGYKPAKGSDTAFNTAIQQKMGKGGGVVGKAVEHVSQAGLAMKREISDRWTEFRLGRNTADMAILLTSPHAAPLLRDLAREAPASERAQYITLRLGYIAEHERERAAQRR